MGKLQQPQPQQQQPTKIWACQPTISTLFKVVKLSRGQHNFKMKNLMFFDNDVDTYTLTYLARLGCGRRFLVG